MNKTPPCSSTRLVACHRDKVEVDPTNAERQRRHHEKVTLAAPVSNVTLPPAAAAVQAEPALSSGRHPGGLRRCGICSRR
jgi:hypothetical protein